MVINEHPFNLVVEELGIVAFLTWKQDDIDKVLHKRECSTCDGRSKLTAQVVNFIVSFMFSV